MVGSIYNYSQNRTRHINNSRSNKQEKGEKARDLIIGIYIEN